MRVLQTRATFIEAHGHPGSLFSARVKKAFWKHHRLHRPDTGTV